MIPQATPLYGYAWSDRDGLDPDRVLVVGWIESKEHLDGDIYGCRPVVAWIDEAVSTSALELDDGWTVHLTNRQLSRDEGRRIKREYFRDLDATAARIAAAKRLAHQARLASGETT